MQNQVVRNRCAVGRVVGASCSPPADKGDGPLGAAIVQGPPVTSEVARQIMERAHAKVIVADSHGMVSAVDDKAGTITIVHGRIPDAGWRASTTRFKATPTIARLAMIGEDMDFTVRAVGTTGEVTAIQPRR